MRQFGDLVAWGEGYYSPRALRALSVIGQHLHDTSATIQIDGFIQQSPDQSKKSCVWMSYAVARFFRGLGMSAQALPVLFRIVAPNAMCEDGEMIDHVLSVGDPARGNVPATGWNGHMICLVEADDKPFIVDTTLYGMQRPSWPSLAPMVALPAVPQITAVGEHGPIPIIAALDYDAENWRCVWAVPPTPNETWRGAPDLARGLDKRVASKLKAKMLRNR